MSDMSNSIDERLRSFERSLRRFSGSLGLRINIELSKKIEEVQLKIIDDVSKLIDEAWSQGLTLQDLLAKLSDNGTLRREVLLASSTLGERIGSDSVDELFADALSGDTSRSGARSALVAFQAIARAYAEKYYKENGSITHVSPYCPVCGAESSTMVKRGNRYVMICPVCGYEWIVSEGSPRCPFCGNDNRFKLGTFMDKEWKYGLMYCQECGSSWRVIWDEDMASAPNILLPLIAMAADRFRGALPRGEGINNGNKAGGEGGLSEGQEETKGQE